MMHLPVARAERTAATQRRRVTILGATGSIGISTADVVKHEPGLYGVEAVACGGNALQLAKLARELGASFAAIADPKHYGELKDALAGSGIEPAAGASAGIEAGRGPAGRVVAAIDGARGAAR